jgi:fumarate reductase flavoprotein subunit
MMSKIPLSVDIVVIGSGASGLAAALTAAEGGAKVAVFEKQRSPGGTSNFLQGIFAVESDMQREKYITYSRDEAFKNLIEYSHWRANPRLVRAVVNESSETIRWLQKQGVIFSEVTINMPNSPMTYHVLKGRGEAMIKALVTKAREKGVNLILDTAVKRILKTGDRISAVMVEQDGEDVQVKTRAVIIASGGYANNKEWVKKYSGLDLGVNLVIIGNIDKNGDGIRMAKELGAAEEGINLLELYRAGPIGPEFAMGCQLEFAATQPDLWVDPRGERFCDESIAFFDANVGNAAARIKEGYTFSLFDDSIIKRMVEKGIDKNVAVENPPGSKPLALVTEMQAAFEHGSTELLGADTIEELAQKMGIDPAVLKATIDEYNRFCRQGHDELFAKNARYLWPLVGSRYYAVKVRTVFLGTMGGIKINQKAEVINQKEQSIPGLYAVGFDAGGMYGDSYPIQSASGLSSAFALNSGRIAGQNVLKYLGK